MQMRKAAQIAIVSGLMLLPGAGVAGSKFDGSWLTKLACEAHGETPAYKWEFASEIKDGNFRGQHGEPDGPGYLLIEGKIGDDGNAKLEAKGKVTHNNAHGVFAMKGNNYSYNIKAHFDDTKGTGTRDEGAGILGRACTLDFEKQTEAAPAATPDAKPDANRDANPGTSSDSTH